jgi:hypothetical protein
MSRCRALANGKAACWSACVSPEHKPDALREPAPPYAPPLETQRLIDELYRQSFHRPARGQDAGGLLIVGVETLHPAESLYVAAELVQGSSSIPTIGQTV